MTDLIAELAEVVARIREDDTEVRRTGGDPERERYTQRQCVNFLRTNHATLTRILTDYPELRAAHHDLVIRLGEVTTELEAARKDASILREALLKTTSVAVTQLFATHPDDVASVFPLSELQRISDVSAPLSAANVSVESIYLGAWVAAMKESGK
jgi:hypothetical protein